MYLVMAAACEANGEYSNMSKRKVTRCSRNALFGGCDCIIVY